MKGFKEAFEELESLGVSRWDTMPPQDGKIKWFNASNDIVAEADYKVILSVGPGNMYTMAYDIGIYKSMGIPIIEKLEDGPALVEDLTGEKEIRDRAELVGTLAKAEFVYQCSSLLVAVFGFKTI